MPCAGKRAALEPITLHRRHDGSAASSGAHPLAPVHSRARQRRRWRSLSRESAALTSDDVVADREEVADLVLELGQTGGGHHRASGALSESGSGSGRPGLETARRTVQSPAAVTTPAFARRVQQELSREWLALGIISVMRGHARPKALGAATTRLAIALHAPRALKSHTGQWDTPWRLRIMCPRSVPHRLWIELGLMRGVPSRQV